jgi:uncharacterized protein
VKRIELDKLASKESEFAFKYEPDELELDDDEVRFVGPLELNGKLRRESLQIKLEGALKAETEVFCDRCLKPVVVQVDTKFDVEYISSDLYDAAETLELHDEDLALSVFEGNRIDIDELAREQFYLALPTRVLCSENCLGLCSVCGINKNDAECSCETEEIDPRWAALKDLKF